eukprot:NODE_18486_length_890_cov_3.901704.p1 GENE.NODE_18486_length_890_cov_3.901704~~NODE_18486_length_890_cov_3.901704.p1  ORF type:complete len:249 (-),score=59.45 NODE_18486_length_890_cov_3.901704:41-787(-)
MGLRSLWNHRTHLCGGMRRQGPAFRLAQSQRPEDVVFLRAHGPCSFRRRWRILWRAPCRNNWSFFGTAKTYFLCPKCFKGKKKASPPEAQGLHPRVVTALEQMRHTQTKELQLHSLGLGDADAQALACALRTNQCLTVLNLGANKKIGDDGAQALADVLRNNQHLQMLSLDCNKIGDAGAEALADALRTNRSVTHLYLGGNSIGDAGAEALAGALRTNQSLQFLHLSGNVIGDAAAQALRLHGNWVYM